MITNFLITPDFSRIRMEIHPASGPNHQRPETLLTIYAAVIIASMAYMLDVCEPDIISGRSALLVG